MSYYVIHARIYTKSENLKFFGVFRIKMFKYGKKHKNRKNTPKGYIFWSHTSNCHAVFLNRVLGDYVIGGNDH